MRAIVYLWLLRNTDNIILIIGIGAALVLTWLYIKHKKKR